VAGNTDSHSAEMWRGIPGELPRFGETLAGALGLQASRSRHRTLWTCEVATMCGMGITGMGLMHNLRRGGVAAVKDCNSALLLYRQAPEQPVRVVPDSGGRSDGWHRNLYV
jgi:hypothetical protein